MLQLSSNTQTNSDAAPHVRPSGRWVTEREYAAHFRLARQTLTNWRCADAKAGRAEALPGYPRYRRFGCAVRYWLPDDDFGGRAA
jgi:hypothetical protein